MDIQKANELADRLVRELGKVVIGQDACLEELVVALLAGGHALLEGVPGTGKTLMARAMAQATGTSFKRIQFTPDLMPSDIIGVTVYHRETGQFAFQPGPIFSDIVLGDEINRAPAKTQSALLEAMQEKQVTVDGEAHAMSEVFTVLATQNPVEFEGTYPLPEAEVDRFMLKILVGYPGEDEEGRILDLTHGGFDPSRLSSTEIQSVVDAASLAQVRQVVQSLHAEPAVRRYVTQIVRATRTMPQVALGASPRAGVMLMQAAKGQAVLAGRDFVSPDDVKTMALPTLRHRIMLHPEFEVEGRTGDDCIRDLLTSVPVPR